MNIDTSQHVSEDGFPVFGQGKIVLAPSELAYNPCDDLIYPSVVNAQDHFSNPLGKYYMYYAPHNEPGGICLAYASSLQGPWTEYKANPLITNQWLPHYDVEHVSSPHAIYIPEEKQLFLYYHGDNGETRYAVSEDGITFIYGGVAIDCYALPGADVAAYARVYRHTPPDGSYRYVMLFMSLTYEPDSWVSFSSYGLYRAWSNDAQNWHVDQAPLVSHHDAEQMNAYFPCSPSLFSWQGKHYVVFHMDWSDSTLPGGVVSDLYALEVDAALQPIGVIQLFCRRQLFGDEPVRISDPWFFFEDDKLYLFTAVGPRLGQSIGLTCAEADKRCHTNAI